MARGGHTVTARVGPKVERARFADLGAAVADVERRAEEIARGAHARPVEPTLMRRFEPRDQVVARLEVSSYGRRAGVDVRGDGSVEPYTGWLRRRPLEPAAGESPYAALRRALAD